MITQAYLGDGTVIWIPEKQFPYRAPGYAYLALRGHKYLVAVFDLGDGAEWPGRCVGWAVIP